MRFLPSDASPIRNLRVGFRPGREPQNAVASLLPPKVCLIFPVKTPAANCTGKILFSEMGFVYRPPLTTAQAQIGDLDALREYRKSVAKVANPGNCGLTGGRFWRFCKPAKSPYRQVGFYRPHRFERLRGNVAWLSPLCQAQKARNRHHFGPCGRHLSSLLFNQKDARMQKIAKPRRPFRRGRSGAFSPCVYPISFPEA